ncbi:TPA: twin-arginine translocation signal domain-containing protein [Klebsiella oxytoca]|nr:twin-arginine translocation signal domain-containing protein [Klebsiella oxytoca]
MLLKTSRRTFLKGLTLSGVAGSLGVWSFNARSMWGGDRLCMDGSSPRKQREALRSKD